MSQQIWAVVNKSDDNSPIVAGPFSSESLAKRYLELFKVPPLVGKTDPNEDSKEADSDDDEDESFPDVYMTSDGECVEVQCVDVDAEQFIRLLALANTGHKKYYVMLDITSGDAVCNCIPLTQSDSVCRKLFGLNVYVTGRDWRTNHVRVRVENVIALTEESAINSARGYAKQQYETNPNFASLVNAWFSEGVKPTFDATT